MLLSIHTALLLSSFILGVVLFFTSSDVIIYAQLQNNTSSSPLLGVNITSPQKGQEIPTNIYGLTISGKSTDNPTADDCQVSVIVNSVKPYQPATANGTRGQNNDYTRWFFILNSDYTSIKEGVNEITAKLSCVPNVADGDNNMTKWYSINVTGITARNDDITVVSPESSPVINSSAQVNPDNNYDVVIPQVNEEQEEPIFDADNDNNDKKISEEIENLRERIMEGVERNLGEMGIEMNLP
jgi:hypothetical protein